MMSRLPTRPRTSLRAGLPCLLFAGLLGSVVLATTPAFAATPSPAVPATTAAPLDWTSPTPVAASAAAATPAPLAAAPAPATVPVPAAVTVVAAAKASTTPIFETPGSPKPFVVLNNRTNFSGRHVFVVLGKQGDYYKVQVPMRPNGRTGFVRSADVTLYQHDYAVVVSLSAHTLTVYKAGKETIRETVAVGASKTPTPTGSFFMRELARPGNPRGAYGPWAFGLSAYSNVLQKFGRGDGQIGIHGTNLPKQLGLSVSHGCIRMRNEAISRLAELLPQGVPVDIVP